ncbi:hypothetical protein GYA25_01140 [Candidatus Woesearchaeota archaeon]|nr:hypothetical protein [Candidatus Woesearchaeota archaeon]
MGQKQYTWQIGEKKGGIQESCLYLLNKNRLEKNKLENILDVENPKFLYTDKEIKPHRLTLITFPEEFIKDNKQKYQGETDSILSLRIINPQSINREAITDMYFYKGKFVSGSFFGGQNFDISQIKRSLNFYFNMSGIEGFGDYLPEFIKQSNLSKEQKEAVKDLIE